MTRTSPPSLLPPGSLSGKTIDLTATTLLLNGKVQAAQVPDAINKCPPKLLDCSQGMQPRSPNDVCLYSLRIQVQGTKPPSMQLMKGGIIAASEILLCTSSLSISGMITTTGLGYPGTSDDDDQPLGAGCVSSSPGATVQAAGSGGSHGGNGGGSAVFHAASQNLSSCAGPDTYDDPAHPGVPGSCGGGSNGGSGGGLVHVAATSSLNILASGTIEAQGQDAGEAPSSNGGSGGGAGGSIWIRSPSIQVAQRPFLVNAVGGVGAMPGGGGGGGGLIHLEPNGSLLGGDVDWTLMPSAYDVSHAVSYNGGEGGGPGDNPEQIAGNTGGWGLLTGPNCSAGRSGPLCQPCPSGSFKPHVGVGPHPCTLCELGKTSGTGATQCDSCPAGTFGDLDPYQEMPTCVNCAPGTFSDMLGVTQCTACPAGFHAPGSNSTNCTTCPTGQVSNASAINCTFCHNDEYSSPSGTACMACEDEPAHRAPLHAYYTGPINTCMWKCESRRVLVGFRHNSCGLLVEQILPRQLGGILIALAPVLTALALLAVLWACARLGDFTSEAPNVGMVDLAAQNSQEDSSLGGRLLRRSSISRNNAFDSAPQLESLNHALMWDKHKYRAKQHVQRLYLNGYNSMMHPWQLPPLPAELRRLLSESVYYKFSKDIAAAAQWHRWEIIWHSLLVLLLPPASIHFLRYRRQLHWLRVQKIVQALGSERSETLWRSVYTRVWEVHRLEMQCCEQAQLGFLDIFATDDFSLLGARAVSSPRGDSGLPDPPPPTIQNSPAQPLASDRALRLHSSENGPSSPLPASAAPTMYASSPLVEPSTAAGTPTEPLAFPCTNRRGSRRKSLFGGSSDVSFDEAADDALAAAVTFGPGSINAPRCPAIAESPQVCGMSFEAPRRMSFESTSGESPRSSACAARAVEAEAAEAGAAGASWGTPRGGATTDRPEPQSAAQLRPGNDPRIEHQLCLLGDGTYLCPYWIELSDFIVYDALTSTVAEGATAVIASINARLQRVNRFSRGWRAQLADTLELLNAINRQLASASSSEEHVLHLRPGDEARSLALVHMNSQGSVHRRLFLFIGQGEPESWRLPLGSTLLQAEVCETM